MILLMFRISKIYIYESNSQHTFVAMQSHYRCSEYQRYTFMKAIHNKLDANSDLLKDVQNIKDIHLWKQFTTPYLTTLTEIEMFRISKIYIYESNSQHYSTHPLQEPRCSEYQRYTFMKAIHNGYHISLPIQYDVQNIKDIHLWKQFTTSDEVVSPNVEMFRISKIYIYESNSQLRLWLMEL